MSRLERMLACIDETFQTRLDPGQIQVNAAERRVLTRLHPLCLNAYEDAQGPLIWALMFPTTTILADRFIENKIQERELLLINTSKKNYTTLYLCSITALPEIRHRNKSFELCEKSVSALLQDYKIDSLLVWPLSESGLKLAQRLSQTFGLPLKIKNGR